MPRADGGLMVGFRHRHVQKLWFGGSSSPLPTLLTPTGPEMGGDRPCSEHSLVV